jgi:hypothetical protein
MKLSRSWWPNWTGECVAIVAAGPSVKQENVNKLRDRIHVIAINESYRLCPWADMLYACDGRWWQLKNWVPDFKGIKVTQDEPTARGHPDIKWIRIRKLDRLIYSNELLTDDTLEIGSGYNSGFQCLNMCVRFGATGILLEGFDYKRFGNTVHWHGLHGDNLPNPDWTNFQNWIPSISAAAPKLKELGVDVVNCSMESAIKVFPKMSIEAAMERWGL